MTNKQAMAAGYNATKCRPIGSTRPPWGIITNRNHPTNPDQWVGGYFHTRREALEEIEWRIACDRGAAGGGMHAVLAEP
jgi:hypothetical protein